LVPEVGLEPTQGFPYRILSPARLPFHHSGTAVLLITKHGFGYKRRLVKGLIMGSLKI
jgi:hypothetical protein